MGGICFIFMFGHFGFFGTEYLLRFRFVVCVLLCCCATDVKMAGLRGWTNAVGLLAVWGLKWECG